MVDIWFKNCLVSILILFILKMIYSSIKFNICYTIYCRYYTYVKINSYDNH